MRRSIRAARYRSRRAQAARDGSSALLLLLGSGDQPLADGVDHRRVEQGGDVAELAVLGHVAKQAAHDLAAPGLWQLRREQYLTGLGDRPYLLGHVVAQVGDEAAALGGFPFDRDKGDDRLTGRRVRRPYHCGFCDGGVAHQGVLHLGGGDAVPRHVHHVVHPAEQPDVAVLVALGAVAGEVDTLEARPISRPVALIVAPDAAQHPRPRSVTTKKPPSSLPTGVPSERTTSAEMPGSG